MTFKTKPRRVRTGSSISQTALIRARGLRTDSSSPVAAAPTPFKPPEMPRGVVPDNVRIAMDDAMTDIYGYANANLCQSYEGFLGFASLAQLAQKPEFRLMAEKTAEAMTRKWIEFKSTSTGDKTDRIKELEQLMERYQIRSLFEQLAFQDSIFGRAQLFVDLGQHDGEELTTPMLMHPSKLFGKLRKFKLIEAMYSYAVEYRADNPMADSFFNPQSWYVMGNKVHASRLLLFVGRPLPDMLKPAYNFGGMSMSQLAIPYVENWLSTRQHVNRLIRNFSITGLKTNMAAVLAGETGDDIINRAELYNAQRDNQGMYMLDMETEDMFQHNVPLGTLDKLQAQSQEHMASISSIPLVVFFGISPSGLNASSEGEIRTWYDYIKDRQEKFFRPNLQKVIEIIQIAHWGKVDNEIKFDFVDLWQPNALEVEQCRKTRAETDQIYFDMGVIQPTEVRTELATNPDSGYTGLPEIDLSLLTKPEDDEAASTGEKPDNPEADAP